MNTSTETIIILTIIAFTVSCANSSCGVTYLKNCNQKMRKVKSEDISATYTVENYLECVDLCNANTSGCLSFDITLFTNGSYSCQHFSNLGRSNCARTPKTQHYVRVTLFVFFLFFSCIAPVFHKSLVI